MMPFSMTPLLVIVISSVGLFWGRDATQGQLMGEIEDMVRHESVVFIQGLVVKMDSPATSLVSALLGGVALIAGSTCELVGWSRPFYLSLANMASVDICQPLVLARRMGWLGHWCCC
jgi:hypothetical protein